MNIAIEVPWGFITRQLPDARDSYSEVIPAKEPLCFIETAYPEPPAIITWHRCYRQVTWLDGEWLPVYRTQQEVGSSVDYNGILHLLKRVD